MSARAAAWIGAHFARIGSAVLASALALQLAPRAAAQSVVADVAEPIVEISTSFSGTTLFIFGAVECGPDPADASDCDLVARVLGPGETITVRRKEKRSGVWLNGAAQVFEGLPGYFAVASTRPLADVLPVQTDQAEPAPASAAIILDPAELVRSTNASAPEPFVEGLLETRFAQGLFTRTPAAISVKDQRLFRMRLNVPSAVPTGQFDITVMAFRAGKLVGQHSQQLLVRKSGTEQFIYSAAQDHELSYGLVSVALSLALGFSAALLFRS